MGEIAAANVIPSLLALKPTGDKSGKGKATTQKRKDESQKELSDKIDLTGLREWSPDEQKEAQGLITEYAGIFAMSNILGKTSLVKHSIRLTDNTPFKECHQWVPPSKYKEVWEHLNCYIYYTGPQVGLLAS